MGHYQSSRSRKSGEKTATLSFKVSGDLVKSDCRKCPISYIGRCNGEMSLNVL